MAYYYAPTLGYQYIAATPGYQQAPAAPPHQQAPPGYTLVPQPQQPAMADYALSTTGLIPSHALYYYAPATTASGFGSIDYQQPQVWPGTQQAYNYWTIGTPGYDIGQTLYPYARTGKIPYQFVPTGQTPGARPPSQSRQTPVGSQQRPARPDVTPSRGHSYFRGFPNPSGQTPAVQTPQSAGSRPLINLVKRPVGMTARPMPGLSRLREITTQEVERAAAEDERKFLSVVEMLGHINQANKGKGTEKTTGNEPKVQDVIDLVEEHMRARHGSKKHDCGGDESCYGRGHGKVAEEGKMHAADGKTTETLINPAIKGLSPDIFVADEDDNTSGARVIAT